MMATPKNIFIVLSLGMLSATGCSIQQSQAVNSSSQQTQIVGWVENGKIAGVDKEVKVKLDTGAKTTSINAEILEKPDKETESGGTIRFRFLDGEGNKEVFERPIVRWVEIKSREGSDIRRPVVRMRFCLAGRWIEEEVNLADRDDFNYPVLIGRNMLKQGKLAVDSSQTFTTEPSCPKQEV
ncbi:RimK/LysX family protein [Chroococcidiopsis sp. CCALA 051]|uniref:ATP-dependent zinc protease family protein n=1 Tax=Chroococcidiopsis sp. CCALA 051 TaxID=869949 RepID=UPI0018EB7F07|nr:RimK/LysX family protein [Chroococcidiopsis sp. CCALA 051]